jgi:VanZ family protein
MVLSVLVLSLIPIEVNLGEGSDKLEHFVAYGAMSFWFGLLYVQRRWQLGFALGFVLMGVAVEYLQGMTDYRDFEVGDMVADALGAFLGFALLQTPLGNALVWVERIFDRIGRKG